MATPSSAEIAALAKGEKEGQAVMLWTVGMYCIFGWDYLMNLPKEIKYIWKREFTVTSWLYVTNRYYGLLHFVVCIWLLTNPITQAVSENTCSRIFRWQPVGSVISALLSQLIMGSRIYILYGKSMIIAGVLGVIIATELGIGTYAITRVFPAPSPAPGVTVPCLAIGPFNWLITFWAIPVVYDTLTFILTLYKWIVHWRNEVESSTLSLLFRDGLVYFAAILSVSLINIIFVVTQDHTLQAVSLLSRLTGINIIMSCKLILNLRKPRNMLMSSAARKKVLPLWQATEKHAPSYESNTYDDPTGITITTNTVTDAVQTHVDSPRLTPLRYALRKYEIDEFEPAKLI